MAAGVNESADLRRRRVRETSKKRTSKKKTVTRSKRKGKH